MPAVTRSRAIAAWLLGMAFFGYAFVQRVAPSVMTEELMRDLAIGAAGLGTLSAMYFYSYALIQIPVGWLVDRYGPRRLMSAAMGVCALAAWAFAGATDMLSASLARALIGGAVAFGFVGTLTIIALWLPASRFATFSGVVQAVGMFGAIVGQAPLRLLIESQGWRDGMLWLAGAAALLALALWAVVPARSAAQRAAAGEQAREAGDVHPLRVLAEPASWWAALIGFGITPVMLAFAGLWAVPWLVEVHGMADAAAAGTASLLFLGWAIGSIGAGALSDALGRRVPVLAAGAALSLLAFGALVYLPAWAGWQIGCLMVLSGLGGGSMVLAFSLAREFNPPALGGTAMGMVNTAVVGSGAVMQPLIGALLGALGYAPGIGAERGAEVFAFALAPLPVALFAALLGCVAMARRERARR